jgi:hypothetical protein
MDTKKEAKKYLNKYFKAQYINETDDEFKDLVKILNEALRIHDVVGRSEQLVCDDCNGKQFIYSKKQDKNICLNCWEEAN